MAYPINESSNPYRGGPSTRSLLKGGLVALCMLTFACGDGGKEGSGGGNGGSVGSGGKTGSGGGTGGSSQTGGSAASSGGAGGSSSQTGGTGASFGGSGGSSTDAGAGGAGTGTGGAGAGGAGDPKDGGSDAGGELDGGSLPPPSTSPLTVGWTPRIPKWKIHSPYNLPPTDRVTYDPATGIHTMFINANDKPMAANKTTDPRAEYQWDMFTSGQNMFDADVWIEPRTDATCIMQVFMTTPHPTSMMLSAWKDGTVRYYGFAQNGVGAPVVNPKSHGVWWNLKVIHNANTHMIDVYVNDVKSQTFPDKGGSSWYFKNGVYGTTGRSETRWRNIRWWTKP